MDNIKKIMDIIEQQFLTVMNSDPEYYDKYNIILSNEQQYVKEKYRDKDSIYIVVKFIPGSLNFGQTLIPINFNALGEGNKLEVCQRLLLEYAQQFNLCEPINISASESGDGSSYTIKQVYTQPQVMSNFNPTWNEFRSLFYMSGTFLLGKDSEAIKKITYYSSLDQEEGSELNFINASWAFAIQLDSQAFYGTNSRTESKSKIATLTLNVTLYLKNDPLSLKTLKIAWNVDKEHNSIKDVFYLDVEFEDLTVEKMPFHLSNANCTQNIGEFPLLSLVFTN